eukprot:TRINITY_DN5522_c0_g1_i10.p1 TRINITY_DN5522_c0_g1~~TRINITY_DN5522_c0_g1_i10.p1  ORF type:complete len:758 (-),score=89.14 TRINITY_DN5522_c0_g1_i10:394-2667(-)
MSDEAQNTFSLASTPVVVSVAVLSAVAVYFNWFLLLLPVLVVASFFAGIFKQSSSSNNTNVNNNNNNPNDVVQTQQMNGIKTPKTTENQDVKSQQNINASQGAPLVGSAAILAQIRAQRQLSSQDTKKSEEKAVYILYASQLGTSQEIAMNIHAQCPQHNIKSHCMSFNELGFENINAGKTPFMIIVASTTGDGDPPDNCSKVYVAIRKKQEAGIFNGINFTCLGLGDSNYTKYQHVPRVFRNRFTELGASSFYKFGEADEVEGLEEQVEAWIDGLWPELKKAMHAQKEEAVDRKSTDGAFKINGKEIQGIAPLAHCRIRLVWHDQHIDDKREFTEEQYNYRDPERVYSPDAPFVATIKASKLMTDPKSDRRVQHLAIDVTGSDLKYVAGDSIGVMPENDPAMVDSLVKRLNLKGSQVFSVQPSPEEEEEITSPDTKLLPHLKWPCSVRSALLYGCDITGIQRKSLLRLLADHCSNNDEKLQLLLLSSRSGKEQYAKEIIEGQPSLLDLLNKFPSSQPPLDHLFDILPPLAPRMYSIACSNQELPNEVHIAFSVVRYQTMYGEKKGVATTWLDQYCNSDSHNKVRIGTYVRSGGDFKHPLLLQSPIIMIGPGTGVAPFRGFLQQRRAMKKAGSTQCGESWLFFGCRREDEDYLYRSDFEQFVADGTLNHLVCAFSRAQKEKVYVQHKMMEVGQQLADCIIKKGGYIFVCGDGARMAKDVHACLENIFQKYADMTEQEASSALAQLTKTKRYVRDIWS